MTKLELVPETVRSGGEFFSKVLEASLRGVSLSYNRDYSKAIMHLDTLKFFTKNDANDIINSGGDVYYFPIYIKIPKADLGKTISEEYKISSVGESKTYDEAFKVKQESSESYVLLALTVNGEFLPYRDALEGTKQDGYEILDCHDVENKTY